MSEQTKLPLDDTRRFRHNLTIIRRAMPCAICGRVMNRGTEAALLNGIGLSHVGCATDAAGPAGL